MKNRNMDTKNLTALSQGDSSERLWGGQGSRSEVPMKSRIPGSCPRPAHDSHAPAPLGTLPSDAKILQTQDWAIYATLGPSLAGRMS